MRFVTSGAWITADSFGRVFELECEGYAVTLAIPVGPESFSDQMEETSQPRLPSLAAGGPVFAVEGIDPTTAALVIVEVCVDLETDVPAVKPSEYSDELRRKIDAQIDVGMRIAKRLAALFVRHLRAAAPQQTWLGLAANEPAQYGMAQLEYRESGERILAYGLQRSVTMRSPLIRIDDSKMLEIMEHVAAGDEPDIARSLLADAWHLSDAQAADDRDRGTLAAATACEIKVKAVIRQRTPADRAEQVEALLGRKSNLYELLDVVMASAIDVSLRKADPDLFAKVKAIAIQRNAIIHGGRRDATKADVQMPAAIASQLFDWLDSLPRPDQ